MIISNGYLKLLDPDWSEQIDLDPHKMIVDPKHCSTQCCGAGAGGAAIFCRSQSFFWLGSGAGYVQKILIKCYINLTFLIFKFEVDFKNDNFIAIYLKEPADDHIWL
jgi:hypothetical protein